jgi:hypothetical protein
MIRKLTLVLAVLLATFMDSNSQTVQQPDSNTKTEKAKYLKEDLTKFLSTHTAYPEIEMMNDTQGDVVLSFHINSNGKIEDFAVANFPNGSLVSSAKKAFDLLDGEWSPAKVNNVPVDKKYLIVFRFRVYKDTQPIDFKGQCKKLIEKQKYERALKNVNAAIDDNQYDYELYELRSKVKELLGDSEGAKADQITALKLTDEIMAIIDVSVIAVRRVVKISQTTVPVGTTVYP